MDHPQFQVLKMIHWWTDHPDWFKKGMTNPFMCKWVHQCIAFRAQSQIAQAKKNSKRKTQKKVPWLQSLATLSGILKRHDIWHSLSAFTIRGSWPKKRSKGYVLLQFTKGWQRCESAEIQNPDSSWFYWISCTVARIRWCSDASRRNGCYRRDPWQSCRLRKLTGDQPWIMAAPGGPVRVILWGSGVDESDEIWQCVKTNSTPGEHQNSWDLWMFIPLKMVLIGIDPYPSDEWKDMES